MGEYELSSVSFKLAGIVPSEYQKWHNTVFIYLFIYLLSSQDKIRSRHVWPDY